jgi:hypothetical protein
MSAARNAFAASMGRPFPRGKGRKGTWVTVGPSNALYPFTDLRNSFNYVPNAYVAGGRTTSIALAARASPALPRLSRPGAVSGPRRTRSPASRIGSTSAARSGSTRWAPSTSIRTIRAATPCTSGPARRTSAAPAALQEPASTSRPTAATRGADRSAATCSTDLASARSSSSPGRPTRSTRV